MCKLKNHKQTLLSILVLACFCATVSYATIPTNQTLNPDCIPTDIGCTISPFNTSGPLSYNPATGTMSISAASNTDAGYLTTGTQTIAGNKTFSGNIAGINGVAYVFPSSQGRVNSLLVNDGNGTLGWRQIWSHFGNSNTVPGTDFIGTTDAQDLVFKTNNIEDMRLSTNGSFTFFNSAASPVTTSNAGSTFLGSIYNTGSIVSITGPSSIFMGAVSAAGTQVTASGIGSGIMGYVGANNTVATTIASGVGSRVFGGWNTSGTTTASGLGSIIIGSITTTGGGSYAVSGTGSMIRVRGQNQGVVINNGTGSYVGGMVSTFSGNASTLSIGANSYGATVLGGVETGGITHNSGYGSLAAGFGRTNGNMSLGDSTTAVKGSVLFGSALSGGSIYLYGDGSLAGGYAPGGANVYNSGVASFVWGSGVSNGTTIAASDYGFVFGKNISNTTANTMVVGWDTIQLTINSTGVTANTFLRAGSSSIITGTAVAQFQNAGGTCSVTPSTSGGITCSSDITLKKNITTLNNTAPFSLQNLSIQSNLSILDKMLLITPVQYNWNAETDQTQKHTGFIAQEVEQIFPDLVLTDTATNLKSLNYAGFTPYLAQAIKDLDIKTNNIKLAQDNYQNTLFGTLRSFFADAQNGIESIVAGRVRTREVCLVDIEGKTCVDKDALIAVFQQIPSGEK